LVKDVDTYYARWATHTFFHSNDGYATFDEIYTDFLNDFSESIGEVVTKDVERIPKHGLVSDFCKKSFNGKLNEFFRVPMYSKKWMWLIDWFNQLMKDDPRKLALFEFKYGKFGLESQVRWELNSLFVSRFHLEWPKTKDYSGIGIKEKLADSTNSSIIKVKYPVGDNVVFPEMKREGYKLVGFYEDYKLTGEAVEFINDDRYAAKTLYAKWEKE
jgi:hypothetical protein